MIEFSDEQVQVWCRILVKVHPTTYLWTKPAWDSGYISVAIGLSLLNLSLFNLQDCLHSFSGLKQEIFGKPIIVKIGSVEVKITLAIK